MRRQNKLNEEIMGILKNEVKSEVNVSIESDEAQKLKVEIVNSVKEAPNYKKLGGWKDATVEKVIIVRNGTKDGRSTVDVQLEDADGNKFIAMMTGRLFYIVADLIGDE